MADTDNIAQLFSCAICRRRKNAESYPLDEDHDIRLLVTCTQCLEQNGINQNVVGLIDQLGFNVDDLLGRGSNSTPVLKRQRSFGGVPVGRRNKRVKVVIPKPAPAAITCTICFDDKQVSEFATRPRGARARRTYHYKDVPMSCIDHLHAASKTPVCKKCVANSLIAAVDLKDPRKLGCPSADCNAVWDQKYILKYLTPESLQRYSDLLFQQLFAHKAFYCLDPKCAHGGLVEIRPGYPNMECSACKKRACVICKTEWHEGLTCQEFREEHGEAQSEEELRVLRRMAKRGARRCTNCQLAVEKDGGCDYIWCPHCRHQFYWASAELVRTKPKNTRQSTSKKPATNAPPPIRNPFFRPCEADAAALAATLPPPPPPMPPGFHLIAPPLPPPPMNHIIVDHRHPLY